MHGNRERLGQSRFVERHPGRDGKKVGDRQVDQFPEKARMMRVAQKAYVRAHVVVPAQTGLAVIATNCGLKRPTVARTESSDTRACLHDPSCWLVPKHHREDIRSAADRALAEGMQT